MLCLKDLEEKKEQEAGNRRCIEQAANDLKVKHSFFLPWMVVFQGETFSSVCSSLDPDSCCFLGKECFSCVHYNILLSKGERKGKSF